MRTAMVRMILASACALTLVWTPITSVRADSSADETSSASASSIGVSERLREAYRTAQGAFAELQREWRDFDADKDPTAALAKEEVEKLFTIEYKVLTVAADLPADELEQKLQALGRERWECFHTYPVGGELRIMCRRRPQSYLRMLFRGW